MNKTHRFLALLLSALLLVSTVCSAAELPTRCDEAYYATLDYYGTVLEGGVVKSYDVGTNAVITDYGSYDQVVNLTNSLAPQVQDGQVVFQLGEDAPDKFYFEGKTTQPFEELPWRIAVSYRHDGAPALAEDLGGASGLFEIDVDVTPNPNASAYRRTNLILTVAAAFNDDDITSLEAPGAELQLIGNLRAVLFAALPGEEAHFEIRVGSGDFSFSGLMLLAVPATLEQLDQLADLREAKDEMEDSYHTIDASLDDLLDALEGVSGGLDTAADGLDQLSDAMGAVSGGADSVYASTDRALADLNNLAAALRQLDGDTAQAQQAVTDLTAVTNDLNGSVQSLKPELENTRKTIAGLQTDMGNLADLLQSAEGYNKTAIDLANRLQGDVGDLQERADMMRHELDRLERALSNIRGISAVTEDDMLGLLTEAEAKQMRKVLQLRQTYKTALDSGTIPEGTSFQAFIVSASTPDAHKTAHQQVHQGFCEKLQAAGQPVPTFEEFEALVQSGTNQELSATILAAEAQADREVAAQAQQASAAYDEFAKNVPIMNTVNGKINEINALLRPLASSTAGVVDELGRLCELLDGSGKNDDISDDLYDLATLARDLLRVLQDHEGDGGELIAHANDLGDMAKRLTETGDKALAQLDSMVGVLNTYEPTLQNTLSHARNISAALQATLTDTAAAMQAAENLVRSNGPTLNAGATAALDGTSAALREANIDLGPVNAIRSAKSSITDLIEDQWDTHAGEHDNLLLIDPAAPPESMTSPDNAAPASIQYILRTQEIQPPKEDGAAADETAPAAEKTTFWGRVKAMFRDLWHAITGLFH